MLKHVRGGHMKRYAFTTNFPAAHNEYEGVYVSGLNKLGLQSLADMFAEGLRQGDLCLAILSPRHRRALDKQLQSRGVDIHTAISTGNYLAISNKKIATIFDEVLDPSAYQQSLASLARQAAWERQRVRAFGEIVRPKWPLFRPKLARLLEQE